MATLSASHPPLLVSQDGTSTSTYLLSQAARGIHTPKAFKAL